jgi:hypothetical protein
LIKIKGAFELALKGIKSVSVQKMLGCSKKSNTDNVIEPVQKSQVDKALSYAKAVGMDSNNTNMMVIATTQGMDVAGKSMIAEHTDANGKFDYAAMRAMYG